MKPTSLRAWPTILTACLCVSALCVPSLAEEPPKKSPLENELEVVRGMLSNSQMKLRRGIIGVTETSAEKPSRQTPGMSCCGENIQRIEAGLDKIRSLMRDRGTCFEKKWDRGGAEAVDMANKDLRALSAGIKAFSAAPTLEDTHGALDGTMRAYLNLKRRIEVLPPCSTGAPASKK